MKSSMKYLAAAAMLLGSFAAHAADLAVKAPTPVPTPVYNWTGLYVGISAPKAPPPFGGGKTGDRVGPAVV